MFQAKLGLSAAFMLPAHEQVYSRGRSSFTINKVQTFKLYISFEQTHPSYTPTKFDFHIQNDQNNHRKLFHGQKHLKKTKFTISNPRDHKFLPKYSTAWAGHVRAIRLHRTVLIQEFRKSDLYR